MNDHTTDESTNTIPYGYCHCGCGQKTRLAPQTMRSRGWIRDEPVRFIWGHHARLQPIRLLEERFLEKVDKRGPDECWPFTGFRNGDGYGRIGIHNGATEGAHRIAYMLAYGAIPEGMHVCHRCDNPPCCNPAHLWLGTHTENIADCVTKERQAHHIGGAGQSNANAKLTEADVIKIRQLYKDGISQKTLAGMYFCARTNISRVVRYETWKHVK